MLPQKTEWDDEYDVVVIGSGFAGLSAAIEVALSGLTVVVLEKMRIPGGNSAISGGLVSVAGSSLQKAENIDDSADSLYRDMIKAGQEQNHEKLTRIVAERSKEVLDWTLDFLNVQYRDTLNHLGGHSVPRTYVAMSGNGSGILQPMLVKCRELNIPIVMEALFNELIFDESGSVEGVNALYEYHFPYNERGVRKNIKANKGVIVATGGFGSDIDFRRTQDPRLDESIGCTNHAGATSEGLNTLLKSGAVPVHLSHIQLGPWTSSEEQGWGVGTLFSLLAGIPYGIMVDANTGKRFVNELSDRKLRTDAMLSKERITVAITDSKGVKNANTLEKCLKKGVVREFETIEELAFYNRIPLEELKDTLKYYKSSIALGRDAEFGRPISKDPNPIENPPFYSIRLSPKVHYCMGGVMINEQAQVISTDNFKPIRRLYAAGEVTGGVHGGSRLGGMSIVESILFGKIAAENSVKE